MLSISGALSKRLQELPVEERAEALPPHEARTSIQFHAALVTALEHLILYMEDFSDAVHVGGTREAPVTYGVGKEPLEWYGEEGWVIEEGKPQEWYDEEGWEIEGGYEYAASFGQPACSEMYLDEAHDGYELAETSESFFQKITFWHNSDTGDFCLKLGREWESCDGNRAHYHDPHVHTPASFVPTVRRVMFLGAGDSMILHEVLRYKTLEVVVGLELDKGVVQASFTHQETYPHFDKEEVEWWFGDAALTLKLLPRDYLFSFDLIIVDLQSTVIEGIDIMKAVRPYAHPRHGIVSRNVNYGFATNGPFARHTVDLYDDDVPLFCYHTTTIGSDSLDLLTAERYVHDVESLHYDPKSVANESTRFDKWYNYRKADEFDAAQKVELPEAPSSAGILAIIELEQVSAEGIWDADRISDALHEAGIYITGIYPQGTKVIGNFGDGKGEGNSVMFLAKEGYITARAFPLEHYCAFDVLLWNNYQKTYDVEKKLASAFGVGAKSSYRIVASGIYGATQYDNKAEESSVIEGGETKEKKDDSPSCSPGNDSLSCKAEEKIESAVAEPALALPVGKPHAIAAMQSVLSSLKSPESTMGEILVLCGENSRPCGAEDVAENFSPESSAVVSILRACPESQNIFACESDLRPTVRSIVTRNKKVDAILIDAEAPMRSGRILHRILQRWRSQVLSYSIAVVGVTTDPSSSTFWLRSLVDRFRSEFFPYNPSFHAEVILRPPGFDEIVDGSRDSGEGLGVSIYSAGNYKFYSDLVRAADRMEKATGLSPDVRHVRNGLNNYVADFEPSRTFSRGDYRDDIAARDRRDSQMALGRQSVVQYEAKAASAKYGPSSIELGLVRVLQLLGTKEGAYEIHGAEVGEGGVVFARWRGGDAAVVYDGRSKLDLNLFTLARDSHVAFLEHFSRSMPSIDVKLRDLQPRGIGGVVVF